MTPAAAASAPLLAMRGICKTFPGVRALDGVDFTVRAGEIHALLGENGAGKSTLIKVLTGVYRRDDGEMLLDGQPVTPQSPQHAQSLGISTVYQEVNLIPYLSVAENIYLGRQPRRWAWLAWWEIHRGATEALRRLDLDIDVSLPLSSYSIAIQQMVAVARALDVQARLLVLDEPTSSLDAAEVAQLFGVMRTLKERGLGIVFITHFLEQVYAISDRLTVLRNGRLVGEYETAALPRIELIAKMIGQDADTAARLTTQSATRPTAVKRELLLSATGVGRSGTLQPLDVRIDAGEVVGLAGLLGSGRSELARLLFGLEPADSGKTEIDGRPAKLTSPRRAIACGLGFCPEDRKADGIVPELSVRENIILALQARRGWLRPLSRRAQVRLARHYSQALSIATPDAEKPVGQLSGGNQQKVILARWLAAQPRLLILDEPTRGIDIGAKAEIEKLVATLCAEGMAILFISSELEEVVRNCQRVLVLRDRAKVGELAGDEIDLPAIMQRIAAHEHHG